MEKKLEASYTIEAAYILPLVFALMYGVIFLGFYLHDVVLMEQCAWEGAFYGAGQVEQLLESEIDIYIKERVEEGLLVSELKDVKIKQDKKAVSVELLGRADIPEFAETMLGYQQEKGIYVKRTSSFPSAADYIRKGLVISEQIKKLWKHVE